MIGAAFLQALGLAAERLHPRISEQLRSPAAIAHADGVFSRAGSRFRMLNALAVPLLGPDALVTTIADEVPFTLTLEAGTDPQGRPSVHTIREFHFPSGTQRVADVLVVSSRPGLVRTLLGRHGRVELIEECFVGDGGSLRMRTHRAALRFGGRRIALRGPLAVRVDVTDGWDEAHGRRTIDVTVRNPLAGTVLEYRGWYRMRSGQ